MKSGDSYWEDSMKQLIISEMFQSVFQDEPIAPKKPAGKLPPLLESARSLEKGMDKAYQNRQKLFLKQARLLANYEDDYPVQKAAARGMPTYSVLTDRELRSYFSWRTKVRRGDVQDAGITFAFLYMFELLNRVGTQNAEHGLRQMDSFVDSYCQQNDAISFYYPTWRVSYIIYQNLPDAFLKERVEGQKTEANLEILDSAPEQDDAAIMKAVTAMSEWLRRSAFYKKNTQAMNRVIAQVLRRMAARYRSRKQRDLSEQLFGAPRVSYFAPFEFAVFGLPRKWRDGVYYVSKKHYYTVNGGYWEEVKQSVSPQGQKKLDSLMKYIDNEMRKARGDKPLQADGQKKWISKIIQEEIQALLDEKNAKKVPKLSIDYSALNRIRQDAAVTQEKLRIEDEAEEEASAPVPAPVPAVPEPESGDCPLNADEQRLLRCLLYGGDTGWVQREGKILSVLLDSINEKLYDSFQDSVLEDGGVVEDYRDELKEIIKP